MEEACEVIKSKIEGYGGTCNIQKAPKVVTAMDDADLAKQLERAELENAEVSFILWPFWCFYEDGEFECSICATRNLAIRRRYT